MKKVLVLSLVEEEQHPHLLSMVSLSSAVSVSLRIPTTSLVDMKALERVAFVLAEALAKKLNYTSPPSSQPPTASSTTKP